MYSFFVGSSVKKKFEKCSCVRVKYENPKYSNDTHSVYNIRVIKSQGGKICFFIFISF